MLELRSMLAELIPSTMMHTKCWVGLAGETHKVLDFFFGSLGLTTTKIKYSAAKIPCNTMHCQVSIHYIGISCLHLQASLSQEQQLSQNAAHTNYSILPCFRNQPLGKAEGGSGVKGSFKKNYWGGEVEC